MIMERLPRLRLSIIQLIIGIAIFWMAFANQTFFTELLKTYPLSWQNAGFLASLTFGFAGTIIIVLTLTCFRPTTKPLLSVLLLATAANAYFMDSYHVLIDDAMINNILVTDAHEAMDLLSPSLFFYILLLGVLPIWVLWRAEIRFGSWRKELILRALLMIGILLSALALFLFYGANTQSFFREHKTVRFYFNPGNYTFGLVRHMHHSLRDNKPLLLIGQDAAIPATDTTRELIIMVVGETARADHFSLNGYEKLTNPLLAKQELVSFTDTTSCGTATAISVPCMFSHHTPDGYDADEAKRTENVLDILEHGGASVLWRDNNSSSKGVADRIEYQDFRTSKLNPVCDEECRDIGMLSGLQDYIDAHPKGDIVIILHQMGNHGPAYYKRYPKEFERFTPACHTNELSECSQAEIKNAYDNAILYTDYFLNESIELLKRNDDKFETAMLYIGDHGESLGENGMYLHGMPNLIAPREQRHVPFIIWIGKNFDEVSLAELKAKKDQPFTQDNVFHTLLGFLEMQTSVYNKSLDILAD